MRKKQAKKRVLAPDYKYNSPLVTRFINCMMYEGKKSISSAIFYGALDEVSNITSEPGLEVWKKSLENVTPQVYVKRRRLGGSVYQIPGEVTSDRKIQFAIRFLLTAARTRNEKTMKDRLVKEIIAAYKGEGAAVKKKIEMHKIAESNKANSHIRIK